MVSMPLRLMGLLAALSLMPSCLLLRYPCDPGREGAGIDADGDGFIDCAECDDTVAEVNPDADEICDGIDNDCNGVIDEEGLFWVDLDGDGYGDINDTEPILQACLETDVAGRARFPGDCNDQDATISPGEVERCDRFGVDENCDGDLSTGLVYVDADGDGYGDPSSTPVEAACDAPPAGRASDLTDCDDTKASVNPGTPEVCDGAGVDEDCDGVADFEDSDIADDAAELFVDADGDGYGTEAAPETCAEYELASSVSGDCDDTRSSVSPEGVEVCGEDGVDEDCDGAVDFEDSDLSSLTYYEDRDGDGYGDAVASPQPEDCASVAGTSVEAGDCDDSTADASPGIVEEVCYDGVDNNCDGLSSPCTWESELDLGSMPGTVVADSGGDFVMQEWIGGDAMAADFVHTTRGGGGQNPEVRVYFDRLPTSSRSDRVMISSDGTRWTRAFGVDADGDSLSDIVMGANSGVGQGV